MSEFSGFEVRDSVEFGRFVIAKRDYRIGDLILNEEPLLISPIGMQTTSLSDQDLSENFTTSTFDCLGCFISMSPENINFCPKCNWPVCRKCAEESLHTRYECSLFEEKKIGVSPEVYSRIYILRAVLMYKGQDPSPWNQFASLSSSFGLNHDAFLAKNSADTLTSTNYLNDRFQIHVPSHIVGQIINTCCINAFGKEEYDENGNLYRAQAVYSRASMFAHNCAPNCEWAILPYDYNGIRKWNIRIYARRNIFCDEPINISYLSDCFATDTATRRSYIANVLHFDCKCSRCSDSTEFSFYTEAIICTSCVDGRLTSDNPTDEYSSWTCNHCEASKDYSFAAESFHASLGVIENSPAPATLEHLLTPSNNKCGLGPNHREIIYTLFGWIQDQSNFQFEEMTQHSKGSEETFATLMKSAAKCLKVFRMFGGMSHIVELESCFATAIATFYFKTSDFRSMQYDPYLPKEKKQIITAICAHLKIAVDIMEWCPYNILYLFLRQDLIDGYEFWKDQLHALKDVCSVGKSHYLDEMSGGEVQVIEKASEAALKTSPNELSSTTSKDSGEDASSKLLKKAVEIEQVAVSRSTDISPYDVISSSSEITLKKPPLSILTEFDFYFDR